MNQIKLCLALLFFVYEGHSQKIFSNDGGLLNPNRDSTDIYLSTSSFNKKIKQVFSQLATGQSTTSVISNYADVDIADGKLGFNGTLGLGNRLVLGLAANGGIDNSISEIFSGFKLNNNTSLDLRLHFRVFTRFFFTSKDKFLLADKRKYFEMKLNTLTKAVDFDSLSHNAYINMQASHLNILHDSLELIRNVINSNGSTPSVRNHLRERYYALYLDSGGTRSIIDSVNLIRNEPGRRLRLTKEYEDSIKHEIENAELSAPFSSIHLVWLTGRLNPARKKFYLYDSLADYNTQVHDTSFTSTFYGVEINYYYWTQRNFSFYGNIGLGYERTNNLDTLTSFSITDTRSQSAGVQARKLENKYQVYSGKYEESQAWKLYMNFYFFGADNKFAFHVFPDWHFSNELTTMNLGLGFVLSFKSKKDQKTTINAEPYFKFTDLTDHLHATPSSMLKRNSIGIRIGLPISPPNMK